MIQDSAGDLWFGSFAGMSRYSQSVSTITADDGLADDDLRQRSDPPLDRPLAPFTQA